MRITTIFVTCFFFTQVILSASPTDTFRLANEAFEKGAVDDAIKLYESIVNSSYRSAALYHNLAAAYISKEQWPEARYYAEKAIVESPLNDKVRTNLEFIKTSVGDPYPFPSFPLSGAIDFIHSTIGRATLSTILLLVFLTILAILWVKPAKWKLILYPLLGVWVLCFCLFLIERHETTALRSMGIVWQQEVKLLDKPDELATSISPLNEGQKVRVLESLGPWCRVDLADGSTGWVESQKLRMVF